jgi:hypothetical protein
MPNEEPEWVVDDTPVEDASPANGSNGSAAHTAPAPQPRPKPKPEPKNPPRQPPQYTGDADERYDQVLKSYAPEDISILLKRLNPPDPGGMTPKLGTIEGAAVRNGDELSEYVKLNFHMRARIQAPALYQLSFRAKSQGAIITTANLPLPHQAELTEYAMGAPSPYGAPPQHFQPSGRYAPPGYGYPPPYFQPGYPPPGFAAPPPAAQQPSAPQAQPAPSAAAGSSYEAQQLAFVSGQLQQALEYLKSAGVPLPPGLGAPAPTGPASADETANAVIAKLASMGLLTRPGQPVAPVAVGVAAPPAVAVPVVAVDPMKAVEEAFGTLERLVGLGAKVRATGKRAAEAFGDPVVPAAAAAAREDDDAPVKPEDLLPWHVVKMGEDYSWAIDKETGDTSPMGVIAGLMNNPKFADKALDVAKEWGEVLKKLGQKPGMPGSTPAAIGTGTPPTKTGSGGWGGA